MLAKIGFNLCPFKERIGKSRLDWFFPSVIASPSMNAFTEWIERVGLRKTEVAKAMGVRDPAIAKYSRDGFWPSRHVALRIMRVTGGKVTPNDLLGEVSIDDSEEYRRARLAIVEAKKRKEKRDAKRTTWREWAGIEASGNDERPQRRTESDPVHGRDRKAGKTDRAEG
jgi:DNA-binding transcriptional regulator YdaS (Cro superfamily)